MTEVEIPDSILMEDNSNVEKAEAYMKELEDVSDLNIFIIYRIVSVYFKIIQFTGLSKSVSILSYRHVLKNRR